MHHRHYNHHNHRIMLDTSKGLIIAPPHLLTALVAIVAPLNVALEI